MRKKHNNELGRNIVYSSKRMKRANKMKCISVFTFFTLLAFAGFGFIITKDKRKKGTQKRANKNGINFLLC